MSEFNDSVWCILLGLKLLAQPVCAQLMVAEGDMSIGSTSEVYVDHNIVNRGSILLNGTVILLGDLRNEQLLRGSRGTLSLAGNTQSIVSPPLEIGTLSVEGGGSKRLSGDLTVSQTLTLRSGILRPDQQLMLSSEAKIEGGSTQSYVEGFLYHSGTGAKFYPVGRDGTYAPATLLDVRGDDPTVGVAYFPEAKIAGTAFHWQQVAINGTYEGSVVALTFDTQHPDYAANSQNLVVLATNDNPNTYTSLGQSSLSQGNPWTITSQQATTQPILTVGFDIPDDTRHLYLPNAFSPAAPNGEDQRIKVYGQNISSRNFYLAIQDSWGQVVYETTSREEATTRGWGGPARTSAQGATTYRYLLRGEFIGGRSFRRTGTIVQY